MRLNRVGFFPWFVAGYFEDRRPASNMDPYVVTSLIAETTLLWNPSHSNGNGVTGAAP
jgi:glutamine synthetase